ncbi:hypothetical protein [Haloarchaeobius sp. HME9146]|uniref:hypothetical protein n=1 Tax=Haloarchaeobius sp. HME9146 TaxID=2978732 RepID=UPI0021BE1E7A|nr:hypothetical protein [Haloarchaeobius sp. HME9146]MCT9095776.1 hypothetical protein [Haloarchaeobius sp. HME9146]
MSTPENSPYDDVVTLRDIAAVFTGEGLLRQLAVVAGLLTVGGVVFGLVPVLYGEFGNHLFLYPSEFGPQLRQNLTALIVFNYAPYLAPALACVVGVALGARTAANHRTVAVSAVTGAFVGCLLFVLVSSALAHSQFGIVENFIGFRDEVPPYNTASHLVNGLLTGIVGAVSALGGSLAGSLMR